MNHALLPSANEIRSAQLPVVYQNAQQALAECNRLDECKDWADKMQALASYAKQSEDKTLENTAMRIRARAIRRCGQLLAEVEKAHGKNKRNSSGPATIFPTRKDAASEAGLSRDQAVRSIRVANVPEKDFEAQLESDSPPTITSLAEQGMARGIPRHSQLGMSERAFQAGIQIRGCLAETAEEMENFDPQDAADGSTPKEREQIRQHAESIKTYLDLLISKL